MTEIEQMISTLESVERYLRNQDLSPIGMQVKGKVLEALKRVETLNIDDVSKPLHNCECDNQFPQGMTMCINCNGEVR